MPVAHRGLDPREGVGVDRVDAGAEPGADGVPLGEQRGGRGEVAVGDGEDGAALQVPGDVQRVADLGERGRPPRGRG